MTIKRMCSERGEDCDLRYSPLATRALLYSDTIGRDDVLRDDMWAVTTKELNADQSLKRELVDSLKAHHVCFSNNKDCVHCALIIRAEASL